LVGGVLSITTGGGGKEIGKRGKKEGRTTTRGGGCEKKHILLEDVEGGEGCSNSRTKNEKILFTFLGRERWGGGNAYFFLEKGKSLGGRFTARSGELIFGRTFWGLLFQ